MDEEIWQILAIRSRIPADMESLSQGATAFAAGVVSQVNLDLMRARQTSFGVKFPETAVRRSTFERITSIRTANSPLRELEAA